MANDNLISGALTLSVFVLILVLLIIYGRTLLRIVFYPVRLILRVLAAVFRPLARAVKAVFRPIAAPMRRAARSLPAGAAASVRVREQPWQSALHLLDMKSLSEIALGEVPDNIRAMTKREGLYFCWINPTQTLELVTDSIDYDGASANLANAARLYNRDVDHNVSPSGLYEDSEGAFIIETFRQSDLPLFYVLRKTLRTMSRNIVKFIAALTIPLFFIIFFLSSSLRAGHCSPLGVGTLGVCVPQSSWFWVPFFASLLAILLIWKYYYIVERNNGLKLNSYVQTYLSRIRQQYQEALASLSQGLQDLSFDEKEIGRRSKTWYRNVQWLALRTFFLELYVRNFLFHIRRNALWFSIFIPAGVMLALLFCYFIGLPLALNLENWLTGRFGSGPHESISRETIAGPLFWTILLMPLGYWLLLQGILSVFRSEILRDTWPRFSGMGLMTRMQEIIMDDKEEIVGWRRRFGPRSGVPGT
jgi:hypothetical protein